MTKLYNNLKIWKGLFYGVVYGLISRAIFASEFNLGGNPIMPTSGLMTFSFIIIVPLVIGLISAYHHDTIPSSRKIIRMSIPLFSIIGFVGISLLSGQEGIICGLMALPIFLIMAWIGALIGTFVFRKNRKDHLYVSIFVLLPFVIAPLENQLGLKDKIFTERTSIVINASNKKVWDNLTRVRLISKEENNITLFQFMGFPRPLEAVLDTVAVGGVRKAIFDRGLFFTETVTEVAWNKVLAFNIVADPESIPPKALDEHVLVGGKYFDVLEGRYEIETINNNTLKLHLTSQFRLSTGFNFYSGFWSKLIMRDIQKNILEIIKKRSEA